MTLTPIAQVAPIGTSSCAWASHAWFPNGSERSNATWPLKSPKAASYLIQPSRSSAQRSSSVT